MNWIDILIAAAIVAAFLLYRHSGLISIKDAQAHLKNGPWSSTCAPPANLSPVICPTPVNLPLSEIEAQPHPASQRQESGAAAAPARSGARSGAAKKEADCPSAAPTFFNMGSYARAERIVTGK